MGSKDIYIYIYIFIYIYICVYIYIFRDFEIPCQIVSRRCVHLNSHQECLRVLKSWLILSLIFLISHYLYSSEIEHVMFIDYK